MRNGSHFVSACSARSHYLNQCRFIVTWTLRNNLQWNLNQNTKLSIHENAFENFICEMAAILSRKKLVNKIHTFNSWRPGDGYCHTRSPLINSLAPGKLAWNFKQVIFKRILVIDSWCISCEIALIWMSLDFTDDRRQSHYLSQCWHRSLLPYGVTRPQWVQVMAGSLLSTKPLLEPMLIPGSSITECVQTKCNKFQWNMNSNTNQYFPPYINKRKFWWDNFIFFIQGTMS